MSYFKCNIKTDVVTSEIKYNCEVYPTTEQIKLGTNLNINFELLSDDDTDYIISEIEKLVRNMELEVENRLLKDKIDDLNDRVDVLYHAHKLRTNKEIKNVRNK